MQRPALFTPRFSWLALCCCCIWVTVTSEKQSELLQALEPLIEEADAHKVLESHLTDLKNLDQEVVEKVVMRQWWELARKIVAASHPQKVDFSFAVRKAVRALKDEADELLRTLNPKYGHAQQVSPAFQWAQNDTSIFLTVKFTVRWNAPGALEVTEPAVVMSGNTFNFTGFGKHSNNKYKYELGLALFDNIDELQSTWSTASVGKVSVTLRKKWPRKWPRLLVNKKTKMQNMHLWMEKQEKLDGALSGMTTVSNSPVTCGSAEKLYCLATDTCKKAENCTQCPGKTIPKVEASICTGMPTEKASLSFKDADMDQHEIGGPVTINKARNEFDIEHYVVYFGKDDRNKLEPEEGKFVVVGEVAPTGGNGELTIPDNTKIPEAATHLLVFTRNEYGEYSNPGSVGITDAVLPKEKPVGLSFIDEDGEKGEVSGTVAISRASDESHIDDYCLHWGKSATRKIASSSFIRDINRGAEPKEGEAKKDPTHYISRSTKIPEGAQYLLVFSKNSHGELPQPASLKIVDNTKPCLKEGNADCVAGVQVTVDEDPDKSQAKATVTIDKADAQDTITHYTIYWGRKGCEEGGQTGAKNGHIKDLPVDADLRHAIEEDTKVPEGTTHLLAFSKNKYGESEFCKAVPFQDVRPEEAPKAEL